jgi:hypothetical protein
LAGVRVVLDPTWTQVRGLRSGSSLSALRPIGLPDALWQPSSSEAIFLARLNWPAEFSDTTGHASFATEAGRQVGSVHARVPGMSVTELIERIRAEYVVGPGLQLTETEAQRDVGRGCSDASALDGNLPSSSSPRENVRTVRARHRPRRSVALPVGMSGRRPQASRGSRRPGTSLVDAANQFRIRPAPPAPPAGG